MMWKARRRSVGSAPLTAALSLSVTLFAPRAAHAQAPPTPAEAPPAPADAPPAPADAPPDAPPAPADAPPAPADAPPAPADAPPSKPPWYQGVSEERQQKARALFREGRELHRALNLADAQAKYTEALTYWEHPELRLYLGRVLMRIGLPLLAHEDMEKALAWGPGALDADDEKEAREALKELEQKQLSALKIRCDEPGAAVLVDGKSWFTGAGSERRFFLPGKHVVMARKAGYYTVVKPVAVLAGKEASGAIWLSVDATLTERRWPVWKPWALVGAGAALGLLGGGLQAAAETGADLGLLPAKGLALASFIAGGTVLLGGATMVILNQERPYRTKDEGDVKIEVSPVVSPTAAGVAARFSF